MLTDRVVVVGAGVGGLSAAIDLAGRGFEVTVLERAAAVGGKMRRVPSDGRDVDGGPTVFTMRWVFEALFADNGFDFAREVPHRPAELLARHAWGRDGTLDLFVDVERSAEAVAGFCGPAEARRWRAFIAHARRVFETLNGPFLESSRPNPITMTTRMGLSGLPKLFALQPFATLQSALEGRLTDPRLIQLYGRYATYCGSSPYLATAMLAIVAHVEQIGVWYVEGGMHSLALGLARTAERLGATVRTGVEVAEILVGPEGARGVRTAEGEDVEADMVICAADANALASGLFGRAAAQAVAPTPPARRSLSALVWTGLAEPAGFGLARHNVFFSGDYQDEFRRIFRAGALPEDPTVYVCAQDRGDTPDGPGGPERLLVLVNAPATGDSHAFTSGEIERCRDRTVRRLDRCGLSLDLASSRMTTTGPNQFHALFPGTGGALYGRASHGWTASFLRPDARTRIPGLYLAGGSVHPGPGVPMAALSGRLAARAAASARASTRRSRPVAMSGGTSTA